MTLEALSVIIALIGLVITIASILMKLNSSITNLNVTIKNLDSLVIENKRKQELHEEANNKKFAEYEHRLTEHDVKIRNIEREIFHK